MVLDLKSQKFPRSDVYDKSYYQKLGFVPFSQKLHLSVRDTCIILQLYNRDCVHHRGGWCDVHGQYASKSVKRFKIWEQLTSGLFGWKVRSRTVYSCETEAISPTISFQPGPSAGFTSKKGGLVNKKGSTIGISGVARD